ncbi:MAG: rane-bound metal-dependent hydrolase [Verrucomicrobiales bacterium]|nr:rane-bound metal-dependent hydrolase [Verrucomicrobiales bacterium]
MAIAVLITRQPKRRRQAALAGLAAGLLPDADVFLRSATDPLFNLQYHRHFTHSLVFSPVIALFGACIASSVYAAFKKQVDWRTLLFPAWLAGLSHLFCDAWTSYGTQIFWPFSSWRVSLDWISIIDPLLTVPLAACVALAVRYASIRAARTGLIWAGIYLTFCIVQQQRAKSALNQWLADNHQPPAERISIRPSIGNAIVWRGLVVSDGICRAVAIRCGRPGNTQLIPGQSSPMLASPEAAAADFGLKPDSVQALDIARFYHFSDGWIGRCPGVPDVLADLRYSNVPDEIKPLWGIRLTPEAADRHVEFLNFRSGQTPSINRLWDMMKGTAKSRG